MSSAELAQRVVKVKGNGCSAKGNNSGIVIFASLLIWTKGLNFLTLRTKFPHFKSKPPFLKCFKY